MVFRATQLQRSGPSGCAFFTTQLVHGITAEDPRVMTRGSVMYGNDLLGNRGWSVCLRSHTPGVHGYPIM